MATFSGTMSISAPLYALITGNDNSVAEYLTANYQSVLPLLNWAIADGYKIVRKLQTATTVTATYDMQSITGDGDVSATSFTSVVAIMCFPLTAHSSGMGVQINPKDGTTGLLAPWGSAYSATSYDTAYGPNASYKNLPAPVVKFNPAGWSIASGTKDINFDPVHASTAISWVAIFIGR